jgi:hypothetical protein
MPPVRFEPTIPASPRPQTYALDRAATRIGIRVIKESKVVGHVARVGEMRNSYIIVVSKSEGRGRSQYFGVGGMVIFKGRLGRCGLD